MSMDEYGVKIAFVCIFVNALVFMTMPQIQWDAFNQNVFRLFPEENVLSLTNINETGEAIDTTIQDENNIISVKGSNVGNPFVIFGESIGFVYNIYLFIELALFGFFYVAMYAGWPAIIVFPLMVITHLMVYYALATWLIRTVGAIAGVLT